MRLTTNTQVSVDGVFQANGVRNEDLDPGMERGGWARPLFDDEAMTFVNDFYQRADAFLFGRRTYELFAGYWGVRKDLEDPIVGALNTKPKYVASTTLTDPQWADTTVLSADLAAAVAELKAKPGGELQVHGSGALIRSLRGGAAPRCCGPCSSALGAPDRADGGGRAQILDQHPVDGESALVEPLGQLVRKVPGSLRRRVARVPE